MPCVYDNMQISLDRSSASNIHHPWPYFQCWLVQNNLKSEISIIYIKKKKAKDNSRKFGSKTIVKKKKARDLVSLPRYWIWKKSHAHMN